MRIGIFDPYLNTLSGGEKYMLTIASCLAIENEVLVFWDETQETEIKRIASKKLGLDLSGIKFTGNIFAKDVSTVSRLIESNKFDAIVYLSDGSIPMVGTKLYIHFQFPVEWVNGESLKTKVKLSFVKKIFCNSKFTKKFIDNKLNVRSEILYPPVDLHVVKGVKKENIILHVGRFDVNEQGVNYKKQDVMIEMFKKMVDAGLKDWKFKLVLGVMEKDEDKLIQLEKMAEGYLVEFIVNISNKELWEHYSKSKIYWHATGYGEDLERYPEKAEHFGITTVEAMGSGVVPVVFNAGGQREIVDDKINGYLCDSKEDFISKTTALIKDEELLKKVALEAVKRSGVFSGDRFCNEVKNIIK
jgi:glycosyltransferase involved in cell wall biosynthesis